MSTMKLYVGNLSYNTNEQRLSDAFAQFGTVESAKIITDRYSGQSKGFGFVEMSSREEGESAISALDGQELDQRRIKVNESKPRPEGGRGGFGGNRGGGGGGGGGGRRY